MVFESPSVEETQLKRPMISGTGMVLKAVLAQMGLPCEMCLVLYVKQEVSRSFHPESLEVYDGFHQVQKDCREHKINCCLLIGENVTKLFGESRSLTKMHGSVWQSFEARGIKCVSTYRPSAVMRNYTWITPFKVDIHRAIEQSAYPEIRRVERKFATMPTYDYITKRLKQIINDKPPISFDLEGYPNQVGVTCYSVAVSPRDCFIVPFRSMDKAPVWSLEEEMELWRLTSLMLSDPDIEKTAQNAMYEMFVFQWRHQICIRGLKEDTMLKQWELYCELPKGLDYLTAMYTDEPYYKDERTVQEMEAHHEYCCKDSAFTMEIEAKQEKQIVKFPRSNEHYRFNMSILRPYTYMQLRGCNIDEARRMEHMQVTWQRIEQQQEIVNQMTGLVFNVKSHVQMKKLLYETLRLKKQYKGRGAQRKLSSDAASLATLYSDTELPILLELMKLMRLRTRFSDINKLQPFSDGRIRCNYSPVGSDEVALVTGRISSSATWVEAMITQPKIEFKVRTKNKVKYTEMNLVGNKVVKQLGTNLQNVTKDLRDIFIPDDEDHSFFQYDLTGADAWTVAADLCALGYPQMLDHLNAGIKPSVIIALLTKHGQKVYEWEHNTLKHYHDAFLKEVKGANADPILAQSYTCAKACQHGTNYGMQPALMVTILLTRAMTGYVDAWNSGKTEGNLDIVPVHVNTMARYQRLYSDYYGLPARNEWLEREIINKGYIDSATGARRVFMSLRSRKKIDASTIRAAASHEPQANTTYATNTALRNMYYDPENRDNRGALQVEPCLMVHDALGGQAHKSIIPWATEKQAQWFNVPLIIHDIPITIPVEGGWGDNWKATD